MGWTWRWLAGRLDLTGVFSRSFGTAAAASTNANEEWSPEVYTATDAWEVQYHMKVDLLLTEVLKIPKSEQAAFKQKYEISQGHWSLEWCHPSPVPFHTYEGKASKHEKGRFFCCFRPRRGLTTRPASQSCQSSRRLTRGHGEPPGDPSQ